MKLTNHKNATIEQGMLTLCNGVVVSLEDLLIIAGKGIIPEWNEECLRLSVYGEDRIYLSYEDEWTGIEIERDIDTAKQMVSCQLFKLGTLKGDGIGFEYFKSLVNVASKYNWNLKTSAGKSANMNGYYTWPRFGYTCKFFVNDIVGAPVSVFSKDISKPIIAELYRMASESENDVQSSDLLRFAIFCEENLSKSGVVDLQRLTHELGWEWWKRNGTVVQVQFDTRKGSRCMQRFEKYCKERDNA